MKPVELGEGARLRSRFVARALLILLLGASMAALHARGGAVEWLLATVTAAVAFCCILLPYMAVGKMTVERSIAEVERLVDGGEMQVKLTLRLSRPVPFMWLGISEAIVPANAQSGKILKVQGACLPGFKRVFHIHYSVRGLRRGEFNYSPIQVSTGDMLGLTVRKFEVACPDSLLVHAMAPTGEALADLPGFRPSANSSERQPIASLGGQMITAAARASRGGAGPDVRSYSPGDSPRRVDWRAMARGLGMQTRISNAEEAGQLIVLLDTSKAAYGGDARLFDAHVGRTVLVMRQAVREGKSVVVLTTEELELVVRAGERSTQLAAEEKLARLQWETSPRKPLSQRLSDVVAGMSRGSALICLTAGTKGAGAVARESSASENVFYGAKLAGVRGVKLVLLLSFAENEAAPAEENWRARLQGTDCSVKALPVPLSYRKQMPEMAEMSMTANGEGGVMDVSTANS
ncbi:DUF58 domain-containing protein [Paenibacillus sp. CF384]|uniref:DUF58 domain-containing protein n=1 Tax=Paenibacillus sp. CF384 TaxID=1884382 RepID=UPI00089C4BA7|nr:DUF58 domain-containing protein [Paenibacillus sp. CF384]SDW69877.1 Uncharacterized conserved protein, DUF58 family, contains vWF domain [Paenibacillus sp. CF384]